MSRVVLLLVGLVLLAGSCERGTIDVDKARPPSFGPPRSVPAASGPTTIPAGLLLPDEGTKPRVGSDWTTRPVGALVDPCFRSGAAGPVGRTVERSSFGVHERRTLVVYPDSAAASGVMADLRRALTECHSGTGGGTWVWEARDRPSLGDDAVEAVAEYEYHNLGGGLIHESHRYLMVQVRNAIVLIGADGELAEDLPPLDVLAGTATDAVATLHKIGWP